MLVPAGNRSLRRDNINKYDNTTVGILWPCMFRASIISASTKRVVTYYVHAYAHARYAGRIKGRSETQAQGVLLLFGIVFPLLRLVHRILISGIIIVIVILNVGLLLLLQLLLSSGLNCLVANPIAAIQYYFCQQRAHSRLIAGV